jgi:signal transduction histidine kinase
MQLLAAAQLRMQLLVNQLSRGEGEPRSALTHQAAENVAALLSQAQAQLRRVLLDLEAPTGPERELHEALWQTAQSFFADTETAVTVTGGLSEVPSEIASVFYRAGREAVSNARRHAEAAHVHVRLIEDPHSWSMEVVDDGVGIPLPIPHRPGHLGVRGMHNRIAAVGGTMTVGRNSDRGTRVKLWVPRSAPR